MCTNPFSLFGIPFLSISVFISLFSSNTAALSSECPDIAAADKQVVSSASIVGVAKDPDDKSFLYCEYYYPKTSDGRHFLVEYRNLEQTLIAQKILNYSDNLRLPEVIQTDFRHGERRQALILSNSKDSPTVEVQYKKPNNENVESTDIPLSDSLVIDAGFDEAIRQNWDSLLSGKTIKMDFLSPVHLSTFNLSIATTKEDKWIVKREGYDQIVSFLIRPSNRFINLFAKPLLLTYSISDKRLLAYSGNVNITTEDGSTMDATIQYYYKG